MTRKMNIDHDENFIEEIIGNFQDSVTNNINEIQSFIELFYYMIPQLTGEQYSDSTINNTMDKIIFYSEDIIIDKMMGVAINFYNLLINRFKKLKQAILDQGSKHRYRICKEAYVYFLKKVKESDKINLIISNLSFTDKRNSLDKLFEFNNFSEEKFEFYKDLNFKASGIAINFEQFVLILNECYYKLSIALYEYKEMIENTHSLYKNSIILREIIELLILTIRMFEVTELV